MDRSKCSATFPGRIVPIEGNEYALIPDPLPPAWKPDESLWPLIAEARARVGLLNGIGRYLPNANILLRPLENREAIQSSAIEGTYATAQELLLFERDAEDKLSDRDDVNARREVYNYRRALQ